MRSPAARIIVGAVAWLALAGAAVFLVRSERQAIEQRAAVRAFDLKIRGSIDSVAELRADQQAYVAAGQGVAFWMPKVAVTLDAATGSLNGLRQTAASASARSAIDEASATLAEFAAVDKRARDYLKSGQQLMAGDVIFTEGGETAAAAVRQLEAARLAEHQALDAADAARRRLEATVGGGALGAAALIVLLLVPVRRQRAAEMAEAAEPVEELPLKQPEPVPVAPARAAGGAVLALKAAAELCTDLGRVSGVDQLNILLGRAADMMDASGVIVWVGDSAGGDLRAVLAHGYPPQVLSRMPAVPKSDNNAAAAAYRTGHLQIVMSRPGASGAVVAPLVSPEGCIGAFTAEVRAGGEASDSVQALAMIFAAQLANVLAVSPAPQQEARDAAPSKVASGQA